MELVLCQPYATAMIRWPAQAPNICSRSVFSDIRMYAEVKDHGSATQPLTSNTNVTRTWKKKVKVSFYCVPFISLFFGEWAYVELR